MDKVYFQNSDDGREVNRGNPMSQPNELLALPCLEGDSE